MTIAAARRLASALDVRSETAIRAIDRALSDYVRLTPQSAVTPVTIPSTYPQRDVAETISAAWNFTGGPTFGGEVLPNSQLKFKPDDQERTNTDTLADDDDLAGFALVADTMYLLEAYLQIVADSTTPDIKWAFQVDETLQASGYQWLASAATGTFANGGNNNITTTATIACSGTYRLVTFRGFVLPHASNPTALDFQWAQNTLDASDGVTLEAGSWMRLTALG